MHSGNGTTRPASEAFLDILRQRVTPQQFETWFRKIRLDESDDGVRVLVRNSFVKEWVQDYYRETLLDALRQCFGSDARLQVEIDPDHAPPTTIEFDERVPLGGANGDPATPLPSGLARDAQPEAARLSPYSDTILHEDYTFANFVVGSSNRFAHAAAIAVAESPARSYNPFFLHGSVAALIVRAMPRRWLPVPMPAKSFARMSRSVPPSLPISCTVALVEPTKRDRLSSAE